MTPQARRDARLLARLRWLLLVVVGLWAVAELCAATGVGPEPVGVLTGEGGFGQFFAMAMLGVLALHLMCGPPRREALAAVAAAVAGEVARVALEHAAGRSAAVLVADFGVGAGAGSLVVQAWLVARARGDERVRRLTVLLGCLLVVAFVFLSTPFIMVTVSLHPRTLDAAVYAFDRSLRVQPGFVLGRLCAAHPLLGRAAYVVYSAVPFGFALMWAAERRAQRPAPIDLLTVFVVATAAGMLLYHAFPVVGPKYALPSWPTRAPGLDELRPDGAMPVLLPRNCMPSLHTTWVLLLWWGSRQRGPLLRAVAGVFVTMTAVAMLGLGLHYVADLAAAVPFAAAVEAAGAPPSLERRRSLAVNGALFVGWLALFRDGWFARHPVPALSWALLVAASGVALWLERRAWDASHAAPAVEPEQAPPAADARLNRLVIVAFFVSGFAALLYEVVFEKQLALTFGSTARAATTVLTTYMGGLALGAWYGGVVGTRRRDALRLYAACEGGIALFCAATPWLFRAVRGAYVLVAGGGDPSRPWLVALQVALGALVLLPPTFLMGVTLPVLARHFADRRQTLGTSIGALYGANTIGAALGALVAGYFLVPMLGVSSTIWVAVALDLSVAVIGLRLHDGAAALPPVAPLPEPATTPSARHGRIAVAVLTGGGVVSLALELVYVHLLGVVAGNSVYAFALMLACFLVALGGGAALMRRALRDGLDPAAGLAWCELGVAVCLLAGVFWWNEIPDYFASYADYVVARNFGAREVIRFVVCATAMIPPAACVGAAYPAAIEWIGRGAARPVRALGRAAALNTAGNIAGALAGAPLVAALGSLHALQLLAGASALLGLVAALGVARARRVFAVAPVVAVLALAAAQPRSFDLERLSSGANVYFAPQRYGRVIAAAESLDGGLTTVAESRDPDGSRVLTLLTNGKFQGDDSPRREMAAELGFARVPLALTPARGRALVVGFGTGVTAAQLADAGVAHVDVVDLSRDIVELADRFMGRANHGVLHRPGVSLHITDGRNWLLLRPARYDLITIELTSIWFAGAATLYDRELYQLAAGALRDGGVLQQWLQLHRLAPIDLASALASLHAVFPYVYLYVVGTQGAMIGCRRDCPPPAGAADRPLLDTAAVERLIAAAAAAVGERPDELVSTDDNRFLEYHTPRANTRPYAASLRANVAWLRSFAAP